MNYHTSAILQALNSVQKTGKPTEISEFYEARLPLGCTLRSLVDQFGLTMKISVSTGRAIISKS